MCHRLIFRCFICLLWLIVATTARAEARFALEVDDEVRALVEPRLLPLDDALASRDRLELLAAIRRARSSIEEALAVEGWFSPKIDIMLEPATRVSVRSGVRTRVGAVSIEWSGAITRAGFDARRQALIAGWLLPEGAPFRQADWETAKARLLAALSAEDFAAAVISQSRAEVDPEHAVARLTLVADSGPLFTLGRLQVSGLSRYTPDLIARYNPIQPGDRYSQARLLDFQSALQNTRYFSSVMVDVTRDTQAPVEVPIRVELVEAKSQRVSAGAGASTNFGPRAELNYFNSNWLDRAWGLNIGVRADTLRQSEYAEMFLPQRRSGERDSVGVLRETTDIQGLTTRRVGFGAHRDWTRGKLETRISINAQQEEQHAEGSTAVRRDALALGGSWTWRDVDNPLDPRRGFVGNVQLGGGAKMLLSDQNFARGYLHAQQYWPVRALDVFTLRAEFGATLAREREGIPQEFLFRAGGAQSVRGYAYQSLGVREGNAIVGGRFLAVGSAEYTHWITGKWGVAGFLDAGNVTDSRDSFRFLYGTGLGARWRSPAGPLALDVAYGERDARVRVHFAIMIAF